MSNIAQPTFPKVFDGYRVLQLSDIHIGSWLGNPEAIRRLVTLVNEQQADLIVFTGDLVNQQSHELDDFKETLSQLHAPDGVYSILGNHDYGTYTAGITEKRKQPTWVSNRTAKRYGLENAE